jgi:hypothetical protein
VRTRLQGLGVDEKGRLALVSRKRRTHVLVPAWDSIELEAVANVRLRAWRPFDAAREGAVGPGLSWREASWPDGSRAILDGRGLLHLLPRTGAEVVLVLAEGPLAAWSSDGLLYGPRFFTGEMGPTTEHGAPLIEHVRRFCQGIL